MLITGMNTGSYHLEGCVGTLGENFHSRLSHVPQGDVGVEEGKEASCCTSTSSQGTNPNSPMGNELTLMGWFCLSELIQMVEQVDDTCWQKEVERVSSKEEAKSKNAEQHLKAQEVTHALLWRRSLHVQPLPCQAGSVTAIGASTAQPQATWHVYSLRNKCTA